jgi:hypothetical protein
VKQFLLWLSLAKELEYPYRRGGDAERCGAWRPASADRSKIGGGLHERQQRRKEEAQKMGQLRATYGEKVRFILFLCGYFDSGYLGYEAAEGIDWVWEHRIDELSEFGI